MLLALTGKNHCGKTTASKILAAEYQLDLLSLADAAKAQFSQVSGIPLAWLYDVGVKDKYRPQLIEYCDQERAKDPDVFIKAFCNALYCRERVICDDLRLPNELAAFEKIGAKIIRVRADIAIRYQLGHLPNPAVDSHPTECGLDHLEDNYFDGVVENRGLAYYDEFASEVLSLGKDLISSC